MILLMLAAQAAQPTAVDAERAFAMAAERDGNWTAFRRYAAPSATMFTPQPVDAQTFLKPLKDPPEPIRWSPTASWASCDGRWAVNTGEWRQVDGSVGFFSTVWTKRAEGWRWIVDGGDALATARAAVAEPAVRRALCEGRPKPLARVQYREGASDQRSSPDGTLGYRWHVSGSGARTFEAWLWTGRGWEQVLDDRIAAPKG